MTDSPALNAHSRAVLVPLARGPLPPSVISIPGPGPAESHKNFNQEHSSVPNNIATSTTVQDDTEGENATADGGSDRDDADLSPSQSKDPYSNLDGAFGNYLADEPRPMNSANHRGRHDEEDLLF